MTFVTVPKGLVPKEAKATCGGRISVTTGFWRLLPPTVINRV